MKPCVSWKRAIALHSIQNLETGEQPALIDHLAQCAGCCEYLKEMRSLSRDLSIIETRSQPEAPLTLHNRIERSLRTRRPAAPVFGFAALLRIQWKIAVAISAGAFGIILFHQAHPVQRGTKTDAIKVTETTEGSTRFPSTFAQYHRLAGFPNEELDAALNCSSHSGESLSQYSVLSAQELGPTN